MTSSTDRPGAPGAAGDPDPLSSGPAGATADNIAELREAQSRLRGLLALNHSLVGSRSAGDVAEQLVEAACATAGAGYARLELDRLEGSAARMVEHAAPPERLGFYRTYLEQQVAVRSDSVDPPLSEFSVVLDDGQQRLGTLRVLDRKRGGPFTALSRELVTTLAATGAVLLDRASQYEQVERRALWLESMRRVEKLVISSDDDELAVWSEIADCLQHLTSSETVALQVPGDHDDMHVLIAAGSRAQSVVGKRYPREESLGWEAMQQGRGQVLTSGIQLPLRSHTLVDPALVGPVMAVPLVGDSGPRGAVTLLRELGQPPFTAGDLELVEDFARQATVALEMAEARSARTRLKHTEAREEVARNLHDHVIQQLFAVGLSLQGVSRGDSAAMHEQLQRTVADLDTTIAQIRKTIFTLRGHA